MATVMGPTPPGTGVMKPAFSEKATSPTSRRPDFLVGSGRELIPQSMTTAPGFTQSPLTSSAFPQATTRMSAERQISAMFSVLGGEIRDRNEGGLNSHLLWQTVTVAWCHFSSSATGVPTILLLPMTTAVAPLIWENIIEGQVFN